jgi:hypothetical protein
MTCKADACGAKIARIPDFATIEGFANIHSACGDFWSLWALPVFCAAVFSAQKTAEESIFQKNGLHCPGKLFIIDYMGNHA